MIFPISRREVLNNLIRFKDSLLEIEEKERERQKKKPERSYRVLLNRRTGDMKFPQKISAFEPYISRRGGRKETADEWKDVLLTVGQEGDVTHFEMRDAKNQSLKPSEIDPLAWAIASETLSLLNAKVTEVKAGMGELLVEEAVLRDLSSVHLAPPKERIDEMPGWAGSLNRLEAEKKLDQRPVGTYLLREADALTVSISFHFAEENRLSIHPYVLTVVEEEGKIVDILLLQTDRGWTFYHDDPNLQNKGVYQYRPSLRILLQTVGKIARHPL